MSPLNRILLLFLAILVSAIAVSEAVFRGGWLWADLAAGALSSLTLRFFLGFGAVLAPLFGIPGLWISVRRGAMPAVWAFMGLLLLFPILGVLAAG